MKQQSKSGETKTKNKGGRPRKEIDKEVFEQLCSLQCTITEIASWFDVDDVTLSSWCKRTYQMSFSEIFRLKRSKGLISLRRSQFQMAQNVPSINIWLGKQYLGQREPDSNLQQEQTAIPEFEKMTDEQLQKIIENGK